MCTKRDIITQATKVEVRHFAMAGNVDILPNTNNNADPSVLDPLLFFKPDTVLWPLAPTVSSYMGRPTTRAFATTSTFTFLIPNTCNYTGHGNPQWQLSWPSLSVQGPVTLRLTSRVGNPFADQARDLIAEHLWEEKGGRGGGVWEGEGGRGE